MKGSTRSDSRRPVGAPIWMVSFSDMMTLILTFFILLNALAKEQSDELLAQGLGSFRIALESHGMHGMLSDHDRNTIFREARKRFNLPPEPDPERRADPEQASDRELLEVESAVTSVGQALIQRPGLALFSEDSWELDGPCMERIDRQAQSLRPRRGQQLLLSGSSGTRDLDRGGLPLGVRRALSVRTYLIERHGFAPEQLQAQGWLAPTDNQRHDAARVDALLLQSQDTR